MNSFGQLDRDKTLNEEPLESREMEILLSARRQNVIWDKDVVERDGSQPAEE